jgi:allophanate hydrolase subunit 1
VNQDDVSLREHLEAILDSHDRAHAAEHKAVELAALGLERRLEGLNELRSEVVTDRSLYVSVVYYEAKHQALVDRLERIAADLEERRTLLEAAVDLRIKVNEQRLVDIEKALASEFVTKEAVAALHGVGDARLNDENTRIDSLENFRAKATLIATGLVILGGILGATIIKVLGGG